jgi:hypothetical protein
MQRIKQYTGASRQRNLSDTQVLALGAVVAHLGELQLVDVPRPEVDGNRLEQLGLTRRRSRRQLYSPGLLQPLRLWADAQVGERFRVQQRRVVERDRRVCARLAILGGNKGNVRVLAVHSKQG